MSVDNSAQTNAISKLENQRTFTTMAAEGALNASLAVMCAGVFIGTEAFVVAARSCVRSTTVWSPESGDNNL